MNIGPTQIVPVMAENPTSGRASQSARPAPSLGSSASAERSTTRNPAPPIPVPDEVVKVHSDTSTGQQILVYEFVDSKSGSLVLQIPSEQMMHLVQEIRQRLQRMVERPAEAK